jgi:hypothetical protein
MARSQVEDAVVNVVINGERAISSFRELNQLRREQVSLVERLNHNSPEYAQQQRRLEDLNAAHRVWRQEINNSTNAIDRMNHEMGETSKSGFWDKVKGMLSPGSLMVAGGNLMASGISMAASAVKEFISTSQEGYIESIKNQAQLAQVIKSTGGVAGQTQQALNDLAMQIRENTGVDDEFIGKGESILLTFTQVRGKIYEEAIPAITDYAAALGQGEVTMESMQASAMQIGKALNDPIKGMAALAKVGVTFDAQQKEQVKTLVESNRLMDAQAIVLAELKKEFGGVAKAVGDTDEGTMKKFQLRLDDIQDKFGKWIVKGKVFLVEFISPLVTWLNKVVEYFDQAGERGNRFKVFAGDLAKIFKDLWAIVAPLGKALATTFTNTSALQVFASLLNMVVIPLRTIAKVISDIRNGEWTAAFKDATSGMGEWVQNQVKLAKGVIGVGKDLYHTMGTAMDEMGTNLKTKAGGSGGGASPGAGGGAGVVSPFVAPTSGATPAELKKHQAAKEKAAKELATYKENVKAALAEVNTMIAGSAKGTGESLDAQLTVINDKYQKLIDKLKKLGRGKKGAFDNEIGQLAGARDSETGQLSAAYNYNEFEKTVNNDAERQKNGVKTSGVSDEEAAQQEYEIEQKRLEDLYYIRQLYGMETLDLETLLADGKIKNDKRVHDAHLNYVKQQTRTDEDYMRVQQQIAAEKAQLAETGIQLLVSVFGRNKGILYAQLAVEKAVAIGRILAQEGIEIAAYYASAALAGGLFGPVAASPVAALAKVRAGLSIANILASGLMQGINISQSGGSDKKYAKGGILPDGPSHDSGGLKLVDPYGLVFGEVEGGEPILSKSTYANNRGLVDALLNSNGRQLNLARVQDATDSRERRISNSAVIGNTVPDRTASPLGADFNTILDVLASKMDAMASAFQDQQIILSMRALEDETKKQTQLRNMANA